MQTSTVAGWAAAGTLPPMTLMVDLVYALAAVLTSPIWLYRMIRSGKIRTDWRARLGHTANLPRTQRQRILFHAVSVGEVNAIRLLVDLLAADSRKPEIVIATTTDTGFKRANELWATQHAVVRYPFDFSRCVNRFLQAIQPDVAVLVELEVWPNFTAACKRRDVPVVVVNGRLTERSFKRYRLVKPLIRPSFSRLSFVGAQNDAYADRFVALGVDDRRVSVTGTMKWDTAQIADDVPGEQEFAAEMGIDLTIPLIVAGSTAPDEHVLMREAVPPTVQLLCAPRKPEWCDAAAADLPGCIRRSQHKAGAAPPMQRSRFFLLDTIGELRKAYGLADVVVVGRSFGKLHGSDLMEPVALGKPTIIGPAMDDFQDSADALLKGDGVVQTTRESLPLVIEQLLSDPVRRRQLATNGRAIIRSQQGATERSAQIILDQLASVGSV